MTAEMCRLPCHSKELATKNPFHPCKLAADHQISSRSGCSKNGIGQLRLFGKETIEATINRAISSVKFFSYCVLIATESKTNSAIRDVVIHAPTTEKKFIPNSSGHNDNITPTHSKTFVAVIVLVLPVNK